MEPEMLRVLVLILIAAVVIYGLFKRRQAKPDRDQLQDQFDDHGGDHGDDNGGDDD